MDAEEARRITKQSNNSYVDFDKIDTAIRVRAMKGYYNLALELSKMYCKESMSDAYRKILSHYTRKGFIVSRHNEYWTLTSSDTVWISWSRPI